MTVLVVFLDERQPDGNMLTMEVFTRDFVGLDRPAHAEIGFTYVHMGFSSLNSWMVYRGKTHENG